MEMVYLFSGLAAGGLIGYLLARLALISGFQKVRDRLSTATANLQASEVTVTGKLKEIGELKEETRKVKDDLSAKLQELATATADKNAMDKKLAEQKQEIEDLYKKFNTEFENIANKILDSKLPPPKEVALRT